jgi:hypothetical protein
MDGVHACVVRFSTSRDVRVLSVSMNEQGSAADKAPVRQPGIDAEHPTRGQPQRSPLGYEPPFSGERAH